MPRTFEDQTPRRKVCSGSWPNVQDQQKPEVGLWPRLVLKNAHAAGRAVDLHKIPKLFFESGQMWKRGLAC